MRVVEGDQLKHKLTGQFYELKKAKDGTFILVSKDTPYRMWFGERDLEIYFEISKKTKVKK